MFTLEVYFLLLLFKVELKKVTRARSLDLTRQKC